MVRYATTYPPRGNPPYQVQRAVHRQQSPEILMEQAKRAAFTLCRNNRWEAVFDHIVRNPQVGNSAMTMDNHISTTILHQAITSKGDVESRAKVVRQVLFQTPEAARIKNGYGSLPLHVICQRNTKMNAATKESLIKNLVHVHEEGLIEPGGVGQRTPLHIMFTDYLSPTLTELMIDKGRKACFMKDKKGFLPAHVACSRHCSSRKLELLIRANPHCLTDVNTSGQTLLMLAESTATNSHPNKALIQYLQQVMRARKVPFTTEYASAEESHVIAPSPGPKSSNGRASDESVASPQPTRSRRQPPLVSPRRRSQRKQNQGPAYTSVGVSSRAAKVSPPAKRRPVKKRKVLADTMPTGFQHLDHHENPANLLLHFSRQQNDDASVKDEPLFAIV